MRFLFNNIEVLILSIILVLIFIVSIFILLVFFIGRNVYKKVFLKHYASNKGLKKYLRPNNEYDVKCLDGVIKLYYFNPKENNNKTIIILHGLSSDHLDFISLINHYYDLGYNVICYDNYGCGSSCGLGENGFYQGVYDLNVVYDFLNKNNLLKDDVFLIGHSLGGYSISAYDFKNDKRIKKAIVLSSFISRKKIYLTTLKNNLNKFTFYFSSLYCLYKENKLFKLEENDGIKGIFKNTNIQYYILYSLDDDKINNDNSSANYFLKQPQPNVKVKILNEKSHNGIIYSQDAFLYQKECYKKYLEYKKDYHDCKHYTDYVYKYCSFEKYYELDLDIIKYIDSLLN